MISKLLGLRIFDIEATNRCNVRCSFCPRDKLPPTGDMTLDTFRSFLAGVKLTSIDTVSFVGMGEPLLNRHLPEFVKLSKQAAPQSKTWVTTNGTILRGKRRDALLDAGVDTLDVSFSGTTPEVYESTVCGARFDKTLKNVVDTIAEIERRGLSTKIQVNCVVDGNLREGQRRVEAFWRPMGVRSFRVSQLHNRAGSLRLDSLVPGSPKRRACFVFDTFPFVSHTGQVLYCCNDVARTHILGDVTQEDWNVIDARRKAIAARRQWPEFCRTCTACDAEKAFEREVYQGLWRHAIRWVLGSKFAADRDATGRTRR